MDEASVTRWQAKVIHNTLWPHLNYLLRLKARMEKRGFARDDPLYVAVTDAYDAVQKLVNRLHFLTCEGAFRPKRVDAGEPGA